VGSPKKSSEFYPIYDTELPPLGLSHSGSFWHLFYNNQIKTRLGSATMNQSWALIFNSKRLSHLLNFPLTTLQIDTKKADPKVSLFQTGK